MTSLTTVEDAPVRVVPASATSPEHRCDFGMTAYEHAKHGCPYIDQPLTAEERDTCPFGCADELWIG